MTQMIRSFTHIWEGRETIWFSQKKYTSKSAAVRASQRLPFPCDTLLENNFWHIITRWTPVEPLKEEASNGAL